MRSVATIIFVILLFSSCRTQSRIILSDDSGNNVQTIQLSQHLVAQNARQAPIPLLADYIHHQSEQTSSTIEMRIALRGQHRTDSLFYWILDGEKFGFAAKSGSSGEEVEKAAESFVQMQVPESLWISIANADSISFRIKLEQADYKIDLPERFKKRLKYFFELAMDEAAKTRPVQEGKMKW